MVKQMWVKCYRNHQNAPGSLIVGIITVELKIKDRRGKLILSYDVNKDSNHLLLLNSEWAKVIWYYTRNAIESTDISLL